MFLLWRFQKVVVMETMCLADVSLCLALMDSDTASRAENQ